MCDVNPFGVIALQAAYNEGESWIDQLNLYLWENYKVLKDFFQEYLPKLKVLKLEGTYLVWVDISATGLKADELTNELLQQGKVMVNSGTLYGKTTGEDYLRLNIAMPRSLMLEALQRIAQVLQPKL